MGRKHRRRKKNKQWVGSTADDVISRGPFKAERFGRFVKLSNNATAAQHAEFLAYSEAANQTIVRELEIKIPALQVEISRYNPIELMHRAVYKLLPLMMQYSSESDYSHNESYCLPTVEYLQYLIARTSVNSDGLVPSDDQWDKLWEQAENILHLTQQYLLTRKTLKNPPDEIDELRFAIDSRRLIIRVNRYPIFLTDHFKTILKPYDQWLKQAYGVTANEIISELSVIYEYQKTGVIKRHTDVVSLQNGILAKLISRGYATPSWFASAKTEEFQNLLNSPEFEVERNEFNEKVHLAFTSACFDITDLTSLPQSLLDVLSVRPGESILTTLTGPNHEDLSPLSTSTLHYKPFLAANSRIYTFYHSGFSDRIGEIVEADLFLKYPLHVSVMAKSRSNQIEFETERLLAGLINPDFSFINVFYANPDPEGGLTELDVLMGVDDVLFLVEVKSGGFSGGAARGAPKDIAKNLSDLIIEGQRQSERAEKYIKSLDEAVFSDSSGGSVLIKIKQANFRKIFRVVVTREDLGWVGSRLAVLSVLDPNLNKSFPWHISLDDLRAVAGLFVNDEVRFLHYLEQRLTASTTRELHQHDEIEHIGLYNSINHYHDLPVKGMDRISFDSSYMRDIDLYFNSKVTGENLTIPTQDMPQKMRALVEAIRLCRLAGRFEVGSVILSTDEDARNKIQQGLDLIDAGKAVGRNRTFRMPFRSLSYGFSVTYANGRESDAEIAVSAAQMELANCDRWYVVILGATYPYNVARIELLTKGSISEAEVKKGREHLEKRVRQIILTNRPNRNDKCPCGSGLKYKRCHGLS